jgi:hypothetical protein
MLAKFRNILSKVAKFRNHSIPNPWSNIVKMPSLHKCGREPIRPFDQEANAITLHHLFIMTICQKKIKLLRKWP